MAAITGLGQAATAVIEAWSLRISARARFPRVARDGARFAVTPLLSNGPPGSEIALRSSPALK
jgi:hypothetical protein